MLRDKKFIRFVFVCVAGYLLWIILYDLWLEPNGRVDFLLTHAVAENTVWGLNFFGYQTISDIDIMGRHVINHIEGRRILIISNACNGLVLYPLFICFILAIPGKSKAMIWMILIGSLIIYLINILRSISLCLIKMNFPQYLDFNHRYTFVIFVYSIIFVLWVVWVNRYAQLNKPNADTK